jgi:hypothetical protein
MMLAELEKPLLFEINQDQLVGLQALFKRAHSLTWITSGGLLKGQSPECSLIFGMSKAIRTEHPTLKLHTIDLSSEDLSDERTASFILQREISMQQDEADNLDISLVIDGGRRYAPRYMVDQVANTELERLTTTTPVEGAFVPGLSLDMRHVGQIGSFYFKERSNQFISTEVDHVVISSRAYSLSTRVSPSTEDYLAYC